MPSSPTIAPQHNLILASLSKAELKFLLPHLQPIELEAGQVLHEAGEPPRFIYFLTSGVAALTVSTEDGKTLNLSLIGREGIVGERAIFEGGIRETRCTMLTQGAAYRMEPQFFNAEFQGGGKLHDLTMRTLETRISETSQTALCAQMHPLEKRLMRWLLSFSDRLGSEDLPITHERIAEMLGVRRVGITVAIGELADAGLIQHSRGRICLVNRRKLEKQVCECYEVMKQGAERAYHSKREMNQSSKT